MHYRNGREAKAGDCVLHLNGNYSVVGYLVDLVPGQTSCNGNVIVRGSVYYACVTVGDCVHIEDVTAAVTPQNQDQKAP